MKQLIAVCGLNCETCDARIATLTDDAALREKTAKLWSELNGASITAEMINCEGCRMDGVKTPFCNALCPIRQCALEKGFATCGDCPQMDTCAVVGSVHGSDPVAKARLKAGKAEPILKTQRLILREMTEDDFEALYKVLSDSDIMQHYPHTFDEARVRNWINRNIERYQVFGFGLWAVCLKETGEMIGDCGLTMQRINGQIKPEIGYHIRADQQRKGYAKEAAIAVRDWTFTNTPFNTVCSYMKAANTPSRNTAMSYGCRLVDQYAEEAGGILYVYAISRAEWERLSIPDAPEK